MKRNVWIFGLILGTILTVNMVYMVNRCYSNPEFESNDVLGYAAMIVVFSMTFFGIRNYKINELGGSITMGKAFKVGALIALVGSTMYVVVWLFYYYLFVPDFIDQYTLHVLHMTEIKGGTEAEVAAKATEMSEFKEMYKSPFFVVLITYFEVLPIGLIVSLISAFVLSRKS